MSNDKRDNYIFAYYNNDNNNFSYYQTFSLVDIQYYS